MRSGALTNKNVCFEIDEKSRYAFFEGKWQKNIGNDSDDQEMYLVYNNIVECNVLCCYSVCSILCVLNCDIYIHMF